MSSTYYQPPTRFSIFPPIIKNLLILNILLFGAKLIATAGGGALAWVLHMMALYPPGGGEMAYTIYGGTVEHPGFWPWQLVTYSFLHADFGHIFFNMFALWMFGVQIENAWGQRRFFVYYFACVIGAALTQIVVSYGQPVPIIGASGGVFGILLAFGMMYPNQYIVLLFPPIPIKAKWFVIIYGAIELWAGFAGTQTGVAHFAHLGGMAFGYGLIQYWRGRLPVRPDRVMRW